MRDSADNPIPPTIGTWTELLVLFWVELSRMLWDGLRNIYGHVNRLSDSWERGTSAISTNGLSELVGGSKHISTVSAQATILTTHN